MSIPGDLASKEQMLPKINTTTIRQFCQRWAVYVELLNVQLSFHRGTSCYSAKCTLNSGSI